MDQAARNRMVQLMGDPNLGLSTRDQLLTSLATKPEAELRNPDPMNKNFVDFNLEHALPNFARSAAGLNPAFEMAGGAAQMATGDLAGGAQRAVFGAVWPKIFRGKKAIRPDSELIDLSTGQAHPRPIGLDAAQRAEWEAATVAAQARWRDQPRSNQSSESTDVGSHAPPRSGDDPLPGSFPGDHPSKSNEASSVPFNNRQRASIRRAVHLLWSQGKINKNTDVKYDDIAFALREGVKRSSVEKYLKGKLKAEMKGAGSARNFKLGIDKDIYKSILGTLTAGGAAAGASDPDYRKRMMEAMK